MKDAIQISLQNNQVLTLQPVPMGSMPSSNIVDWHQFQGKHVDGTRMDSTELDRLQAFMRRHNTEALTDGAQYLTIAGNQLAHCYPAKFPPK